MDTYGMGAQLQDDMELSSALARFRFVPDSPTASLFFTLALLWGVVPTAVHHYQTDRTCDSGACRGHICEIWRVGGVHYFRWLDARWYTALARLDVDCFA